MKLRSLFLLMINSMLILTLLPGCSANETITTSNSVSTTDSHIDLTKKSETTQDCSLSVSTAGHTTSDPAQSASDGTADEVSEPGATPTAGSTKPGTATPTAGSTTSGAATPTTGSTQPTAASQPAGPVNYRQEMRNFVKNISAYTKGLKQGFAVIPQNGEDIIADGSVVYQDYLQAIDGIGREDFLYGYSNDNVATPANDRNYILSFLNIFKANGKSVLITDYCSSTDKVQNSYDTNLSYGFISFAADQRDLNSIPSFPQPLFNENAGNIDNVSSAGNFLYIINPDRFETKNELIDAIKATNYDLIILDLFFNESPLTASDIAQIKVKNNGARRMAICYMSIGEAEVYRYYWNSAWIQTPPSWLDQENPDWAGNYKVKYWDPAWQQVIYGNDQSYVKRILDAGFDGVYLDIIDAFEYYEDQ